MYWGNGQVYVSMKSCINGHLNVDSNFLGPLPQKVILTPKDTPKA